MTYGKYNDNENTIPVDMVIDTCSVVGLFIICSTRMLRRMPSVGGLRRCYGVAQTEQNGVKVEIIV